MSKVRLRPSLAVPVGGVVPKCRHQALSEAVVVVVVVHAPLAVDLKALEVLLHDEVDHAGDGVRAVGRGGAAGDDFDPLDQPHRNLIEVGSRLRDRRIRRTDAETPSIDQHQGAGRAQARAGPRWRRRPRSSNRTCRCRDPGPDRW